MSVRSIPKWLVPSVVIGAIVACICFVALRGVQYWRLSQLRDKATEGLVAGAGRSEDSRLARKLPSDVLSELAQQQDVALRGAVLDLKLLEYGIDPSEARLSSGLALLEGVAPATDPDGLPNLRVMNVVNKANFVWAKRGPFRTRASDLEQLALRFSTSMNFIERDVAAGLAWTLVVVPRDDRPADIQAQLERTLVNLSMLPDARENLAGFADSVRKARSDAGQSPVLFDSVDAFLASVSPK